MSISFATEKDIKDDEKISQPTKSGDSTTFSGNSLCYRIFRLSPKGGCVNIGYSNSFEEAISGKFLDKNGNPFAYDPATSENYMVSLTECVEGNSRNNGVLNYLLFDIDGVPKDKYVDSVLSMYVDLVGEALDIPSTVLTATKTGNGLHVLVRIAPIPEAQAKVEYSEGYSLLCAEIQERMAARSLEGSVDIGVFAVKKMTRIHGSANVKTGVPDTRVDIFKKAPPTFVTDIANVVKKGKIKDVERISEKVLDRMKFDGPAILAGCDFVNWVRQNPSHSEEQWYAMLGIVGRADAEAAHEYSKISPDYTHETTEAKLTQALANPGNSCVSIEKKWEGCKTCPNYGAVAHPLALKSPDFVESEARGFRKFKSDGSLGGYDTEDVAKANARDANLLVLPKSVLLYNTPDALWNRNVTDSKDLQDNLVMSKLAEVVPKDVQANRSISGTEYVSMLKVYKILTAQKSVFVSDTMTSSSSYKLSLENGTYDFKTKKLTPRKKTDYQFSVRPFEYDPDATCPRFDRFLKEITQAYSPEVQKEREAFLMLMMASVVSNHPINNNGKFFILLGEGRNGKSIFTEVIQHMVGEASVSGHDFTVTNRAQSLPTDIMTSKMILCEEPSRNIFGDGCLQEIKKICTKATHAFRDIGGQSIQGSTNAKVIFCTNNLGELIDKSMGARRRAVIITFDRTFRDGQEPELLKTLKAEASGILNRVVEWFDTHTRNNEVIPISADSDSADMLDVKFSENDIHNFLRSYYTITENPTVTELPFCTPIEEIKRHYHQIDSNDRVNIGLKTFGKQAREYIAHSTGSDCIKTRWRRVFNRYKVVEGDLTLQGLPLKKIDDSSQEV